MHSSIQHDMHMGLFITSAALIALVSICFSSLSSNIHRDMHDTLFIFITVVFTTLKQNSVDPKQNRISECHTKDVIRGPIMPSHGSHFEPLLCCMFMKYSASSVQSNYCFSSVIAKVDTGNTPDNNDTEASGFLWRILRGSASPAPKRLYSAYLTVY